MMDSWIKKYRPILRGQQAESQFLFLRHDGKGNGEVQKCSINLTRTV